MVQGLGFEDLTEMLNSAVTEFCALGLQALGSHRAGLLHVFRAPASPVQFQNCETRSQL